MRSQLRTFGLVLVVATLGCDVSAAAQDAWFNPAITASIARTDILGLHLREIEAQSGELLRSPEDIPAPRPNELAAFGFRSDSARTKRNLAQFVAKSREQNPAAAAELERNLASVDIVGEAGKGMRAMGLDPHNIADAYALWWVLAWSAGNQTESPSDAPTYQAVQAQARAAFTATPGLAERSDAEKQQFAEAMIVQAMILDSANDAVRGDPAQMKALADQAKRGAKEMGLDLSTMVLTSDGFRPRKGAALDVSGGEERFTANGGDTSDATPLTTYAALAAAGGAGVAAIFLFGKAMGRRG